MKKKEEKKEMTYGEKVELLKAAIWNIGKGDDDYAEKNLLEFDLPENCYGEGKLRFGGMKLVIESIWKEGNRHDEHVMVHVGGDFEGDIKFSSLGPDNMREVVYTMYVHIEFERLSAEEASEVLHTRWDEWRKQALRKWRYGR